MHLDPATTYSTREPVDVQKFRKRLEEQGRCASASPYTRQAARTLIYRLAFGVLGTLLLSLSLNVFIRNPNWVCELYIGYCWLIKAIIGGLAAFLGSSAWGVTILLKTENEAILAMSAQTRQRLYRHYRSALAKHEAPPFWWIGTPDKKLVHLRYLYQEAKHKITDLRDAKRPLIRQRGQTKDMNESLREKLFNEALWELKVSFDEVTESFRQAT